MQESGREIEYKFWIPADKLSYSEAEVLLDAHYSTSMAHSVSTVAHYWALESYNSGKHLRLRQAGAEGKHLEITYKAVDRGSITDRVEYNLPVGGTLHDAYILLNALTEYPARGPVRTRYRYWESVQYARLPEGHWGNKRLATISLYEIEGIPGIFLEVEGDTLDDITYESRRLKEWLGKPAWRRVTNSVWEFAACGKKLEFAEEETR